jgi:hypothetical protein
MDIAVVRHCRQTLATTYCLDRLERVGEVSRSQESNVAASRSYLRLVSIAMEV